MNEEQRRRLALKKAALQQKLLVDRDCQFLKDITDLLEQTNAPYETIPSSKACSDWIVQHFPIVSWGRVDWSQVAEHQCLEECGTEASAAWLLNLVQEQQIDNPWVTVTWAEGKTPNLRLRLQDAIAHLEDLSAKSWDMWIYDESDHWILEHYHEGEWCWGRSPDPLVNLPILLTPES